MKPNEILGMLPAWAKSTPEEIVAMPSWAMPCRFGETACVMRMDAILPSDTLNISIMFADEQYTLSLADTPVSEIMKHRKINIIIICLNFINFYLINSL